MEPQDPFQRLEYLERLAAGLATTCHNLRFELPYYKPDDLQGRYAKKFLAALELQLAETKARAEDLRKTLPAAPPRPEGE